MDVLVVGSFMMDLVVTTKTAPHAGETLIGKHFNRYLGGKGVNQAVAAKRLGSNVQMIGMVGDDDFGIEFMQLLKDEGIIHRHVFKNDQVSTGVGSIVVEENGQNRIVVVPGANLAFSSELLNELKSEFKKASIVILQCEMSPAVLEHAINIAYDLGIPILLNPAPVQRMKDELLSKITYMTPNESELALLTNHPIRTLQDVEVAASILVEKGVKQVIVTLADKGAYIKTAESHHYVAGYKVNAVDTVAAGDSFNGALATQIINNVPLEQAVHFANAVGAMTVTKLGAVPSLPTMQEVKEFIAQQKENI